MVDLGAAPGGWSQVAAKRVGPSGTVIAIDLLQMEPVAGVTFVQGDFTTRRGLAALEAALAGARPTWSCRTWRPNMSGIAVSDQARSMELAELARDFALLHLQPGGRFLVKIFQGAGYDDYLRVAAPGVHESDGPQARRVARRERRAIPARAGSQGA